MADPDKFIGDARSLVDDVIQGALRRLETSMSDREKSFEGTKILEAARQNTFIQKEDGYDVKNIEWLTIDQFSEERAENKLHEFIKTWDYDNSWLYCIDAMGADEYEFDTRYRFRVRWSIPTRRKPIPRATASVYFTFVVSKINPRSYPVEVYYVFETNRLVHKPGHSRFREKWLKDIIESKVMMMEAVAF